MHKSARVMIREIIVPGVHDQLLEVLSEYPRKSGNQFVLTLSETCLDQWPVTIGDYQVPDSPQSQSIKITISQKKYPKLFALYASLPHGMKGAIILNLLNRHLVLKEAEPEKVNKALQQMLASASSADLAKATTAPQQGDEMLNNFRANNDSEEAMRAKAPEPVTSEINTVPGRSNEQQVGPAIADTFFDEDRADPFASLPPMSFD